MFTEFDKDKGGKNSFYSPYSIYTAYSVIYEASDERTKRQIQDLFNFEENAEKRHKTNKDLHKLLNPKSGDYELKVANAIWYDGKASAHILESYKKLVEEVYKTYFNNTIKKLSNSREVSLAIPKFEFKTKFDLVGLFAKQGITDLFNKALADLSRGFLVGDLVSAYVSKSSHFAYVKVDEEGTEAAAVTVTSIGQTDSIKPEPIYFTANHPFVYLIRDKRTNSILFIGKMTDPTDKGSF